MRAHRFFFAVAVVTFASLGALSSACGGAHGYSSPPMSGSAPILPSPVIAERVPVGDATQPSSSAPKAWTPPPNGGSSAPTTSSASSTPPKP